jgi:hypothetical protein
MLLRYLSEWWISCTSGSDNLNLDALPTWLPLRDLLAN